MTDHKRLQVQPEISLAVQASPGGSPPPAFGALEILEATSRTFFIPISRLPAGLLEAVASGYLCLRAIDDIEDHPDLEPSDKIALLRLISQLLQSLVTGLQGDDLEPAFDEYRRILPEVTLRLCEWVRLAPESIAPRIWDATAAMADRMADWVACNWKVQEQADLDRYTFGVAGTVGLMLSDLWAWYDGTPTDRLRAIGFGRGLQAVNILRNRDEDLGRGVDFFPQGWDAADMYAYAHRNLEVADAYLQDLPCGPARSFCEIPLVLAHATLVALAEGRSKLSRAEVMRLVGD